MGLLSILFSVPVLLAVLAIILLAASVKVVPQGYQYTVEQFGRFTRLLGPGLAFIIPFVDRIGRKINVMESVLDIPQQIVITRDNAMVSCDAVVFTQVMLRFRRPMRSTIWCAPSPIFR